MVLILADLEKVAGVMGSSMNKNNILMYDLTYLLEDKARLERDLNYLKQQELHEAKWSVLIELVSLQYKIDRVHEHIDSSEEIND